MSKTQQALNELGKAIAEEQGGSEALPSALRTIEAMHRAALEQQARTFAGAFAQVERMLAAQQAAFERVLNMRLAIVSPQAAALDARLDRVRAVGQPSAGETPHSKPAAEPGGDGRPDLQSPDDEVKMQPVTHERVLAETQGFHGGHTPISMPRPTT